MTHPELILRIESQHGSETRRFPVRGIVCSGFTSRDPRDAERHIRELEGLGISRPKTAPVFFLVASYLATAERLIEVQGPFTSGEVEIAFLFGPGGPWVTVGSDHTDRFFERHSTLASKQLCPKVVADSAWPLTEVEDHWDELVLRAWVRSGRARRLYQEATLATLLPPKALLAGARRHAGRDLSDTLLFAGTIPTVDGQVVYGDAYELELTDPRLDRRIRTQYGVRVLEPGRR